MSIQSYILGQLSNEVIKWNNVFQDPNMPLEQCIENQLRVCEEEDTEYWQAFMASDKKEMLDAICDRFFTHTYLYELSKQSDDKNLKQCAIETLEILFDDIATCGISFETTISAIHAVIKSNWSKFVPINVMSHRIACEEAAWIEANRKCKGTVRAAQSLDNQWLFFRDMDGKGKLMKPRCFVAPDFSNIKL